MAEETPKVSSEQESKRNPDGTFKPGVSGNPGGRPKGRTMISVLMERMEEIPNGQTKPWVEQLAEVLLDAIVVRKETAALKILAEYTEQKPKQGIELDVNKENVDALTAVLRAFENKNATTSESGASGPRSQS